ncbi:hypothetical protein UFOVP120_73 [uncultured Caudovirales phage]|uniref:Uncharacterized protein n=1 Tax=uncultured Caudovirales phage TaxID=2100421 RepID=A0A6J5LCR8_9CAUD|nr:hypothetical protein UFOVP120_73 [uncultured Caudovirales phage]
MPHSSLKLVPGVDQNRTPALNEAAISYSNLIRFIPDKQGLGLVQKIGGWTQFFTSAINSVVRALWAWEDINGTARLAVGAEASLDVISGASGSRGLKNITPQTTTADIAVSVTTVATPTPSSIVTIDAVGSGLDAYDTVDIRTQISVGGLVLFGLYPVIPVGTNQFQIQAVDVLGYPVYPTSNVTGGGAVPSFAFTSGASTVSVTLADHGYLAGDTFPILVSLSAGSVTLYGNYTVSAVTSSSVFVINASSSASTTPTLTASGTGTTATLTYSSSYTIPVGSTIVVAGVTPAGYNGTYTVTASSAGSVSYANATTGAQTVAGTIFVSVAKENLGKAEYVYYNGIGPLAANSGYGVGGYGTGGYGSGIPPSSGIGTAITAIDWTLDNWGETLLACPLNGPIYEWSPTTNNPVATILPNAPQANDGMFVAMPQRQIIAWGSTFNGIQDLLLIRWCDVNDYGVWTSEITNQAGSYRIPKGSRIVQCIQGPQQGLVWTDLGVWAMQYVGQPYVYQFNEIGTGCGLIGRKAATSMNGVVYWMGQSQFFKLSGSGVEPILCPIWDVIFQDLDRNNLDKIRVAANSRFGEVSWFYPTTGNGGEINAYVKYNIALNQWDYGVLSRTAWINESVLGPPIGAGILPGGTGNFIVQHETSTDAVNASNEAIPIDAYFETGYFALTDADVKMFVDQVWPDMKWGYFGGTQNATVQLTFYATDYPGQTPLSYGPYSLTQNTTFITPRMRGRLVAVKIESTDIGSFWRIGNMRYRVQVDGKY